MTPPKKPLEYRDGEEAASRFDRTVTRLLKVTKEELAKREATYKEQKHQKPKRHR